MIGIDNEEIIMSKIIYKGVVKRKINNKSEGNVKNLPTQLVMN